MAPTDNTSAHFSHDELKCHGSVHNNVAGRRADCPHCGGLNLCIPALVDALEDLRTVAGDRPIAVDSAYRCPWHNKAVGGVNGSEHTRGTAADIRIHGMTAREMYLAAQTVPGFRRGGIGVATHQGYIHVDVRLHTARWTYDVEGKQAPWDPALNPEVDA